MAQVMKKRSLVNPGTRKRRRRNPNRRMTAKQIKYFGTARQRAALRARHSHGRKRNAGTRKGRAWSQFGVKRKISRRPNAGYFSKRKSLKRYRVKAKSSPSDMSYNRKYFKQISSATKAKRRKRKNVGAIYSIGLAGLAGNPGTRKRRKRNNIMARKRRVTRRRTS